ncbi:MAG TPA: hypothetical protein PK380_07755 [Deltaproteobacteria bacterium]|nr:hypothetical protein [Deltaproteobacteria bacterium]
MIRMGKGVVVNLDQEKQLRDVQETIVAGGVVRFVQDETTLLRMVTNPELVNGILDAKTISEGYHRPPAGRELWIRLIIGVIIGVIIGSGL